MHFLSAVPAAAALAWDHWQQLPPGQAAGLHAQRVLRRIPSSGWQHASFPESAARQSFRHDRSNATHKAAVQHWQTCQGHRPLLPNLSQPCQGHISAPPSHGSVAVQTARDAWCISESPTLQILWCSCRAQTRGLGFPGHGAHLELSAEGAVWGTAA